MLCSSCPPSSPDLPRTNASLIAVRAPNRPEVAPENALVALLCILTAKTNIRRRVSIKLYIFSLCSRSQMAAMAFPCRPVAPVSPLNLVPPPSQRLPRQLSNLSSMHWMRERDGGAWKGKARPGPSKCGLRDPHGSALTASFGIQAWSRHFWPVNRLNPPVFEMNFAFHLKLKSFFSTSMTNPNMCPGRTASVRCWYKQQLSSYFFQSLI